MTSAPPRNTPPIAPISQIQPARDSDDRRSMSCSRWRAALSSARSVSTSLDNVSRRLSNSAFCAACTSAGDAPARAPCGGDDSTRRSASGVRVIAFGAGGCPVGAGAGLIVADPGPGAAGSAPACGAGAAPFGIDLVTAGARAGSGTAACAARPAAASGGNPSRIAYSRRSGSLQPTSSASRTAGSVTGSSVATSIREPVSCCMTLIDAWRTTGAPSLEIGSDKRTQSAVSLPASAPTTGTFSDRRWPSTAEICAIPSPSDEVVQAGWDEPAVVPSAAAIATAGGSSNNVNSRRTRCAHPTSTTTRRAGSPIG